MRIYCKIFTFLHNYLKTLSDIYIFASVERELQNINHTTKKILIIINKYICFKIRNFKLCYKENALTKVR